MLGYLKSGHRVSFSHALSMLLCVVVLVVMVMVLVVEVVEVVEVVVVAMWSAA